MKYASALLLVLGLLLAVGQPASAGVITAAPGSLTQCPAVGSAASCAVLYRFNADGTIDTLVDPTIPSTDDVEDTLVGVLNLTSSPLPSITLSGTGVSGIGIFAFDDDGVSTAACPEGSPGDTYCANFDSSVIGARDGTNSFSGINGTGTVGTAVFGATGIVAGGSGWFVLEDQVNFSAPPPVGNVPEPGTFGMLSAGLLVLMGGLFFVYGPK